MAIQKELWVNYIIENLFKDGSFMEKCFKEDDYVIAGKVVHIPQAGAKPNIVKNRTSIPAVAVQRNDQDIVYVIDEFTSDPTHIPHADTIELSYDKIANVLADHVTTLREVIGDSLLVNWLEASTYPNSANISAAPVIRTSGSAVASHLAGTTGNRKKFVKEDLKRARFHFNKLNIPKENRYALVSSDMLDQLLDDPDLMKRDTSLEMDVKNGVIARLYGFDLLERSSTAVYTNATTPVVKPVGALPNTSDNDSVICWQENCVARALGTVDFFEDLRNPTYYGDIYSALVRMGGRKRRKNAEGILAIVQEHA